MPSSIRRVLIANRGEIAVRIIRTCRERGLETVAVFSEVDRAALHVQMADCAVPLGPAPARESYLVIDKIMAACRESGADALHPGYGFLAENPDLATACADEGITFIGPPARAMETMGSKTQARAAAVAAGTPVVPGDNGPGGRGFASPEAARRAAEALGFPVLIKAAAGGGGKGMRRVDGAAALAAAFESAKREAKAAFADDALYLEKAIERPRHVEVQVFADEHGQVVHLGERDCSVQRRHQKVIEESPSPAVTGALRRAIGEAAVRATRACDYRGAGTIEFLLDEGGRFYFLEMNTRLQVEHPVTELVYGLDLVAWQLEVAAGGKLPLGQEELDRRRRGAAIECRIYAEDSLRFLPSPGRITHLRTPGGPFIRNDMGVYEGSEISMHYDPLISKLIAWGSERSEALARMRRALGEYVVRGIETNVGLHRRVLGHEAFCAGDYDTGFLEREKDILLAPGAAHGDLLDVAAIAAALEAMGKMRSPVAADSDTSQPISRWRGGTRGWRSDP